MAKRDLAPCEPSAELALQRLRMYLRACYEVLSEEGYQRRYWLGYILLGLVKCLKATELRVDGLERAFEVARLVEDGRYGELELAELARLLKELCDRVAKLVKPLPSG